MNKQSFRPGNVASYGSMDQVAFGLYEGNLGAVPLITMIYLRPYL